MCTIHHCHFILTRPTGWTLVGSACNLRFHRKYLWQFSYLPAPRISMTLRRAWPTQRLTAQGLGELNVEQMSSVCGDCNDEHKHACTWLMCWHAVQYSTDRKSGEMIRVQWTCRRYLCTPMERCLLPASCPVVMTIALTASMPLVYKYQQKQLRASASPFMREHPS